MKTLKTNKIIAIVLGFIAAICFATFGLTFSANADVVEYEKGKVEIYQIAPDADTLAQGYVIKTVNDKIIVIDGGVGDYGKDVYLTKAIRSILGLGEGEAFHVDAWFLSHAHNDHIFELAKMLNGYVAADDASLVDGKVIVKVPNSLTAPSEYTDVAVTPDNNFTIGRFYFDFPTWNYKSGDTSACLINLKQGLDVYAAAHPEVEDFALTDGALDVYSEINGKYINSQTIANGQDIYIDGIRFEMLQTWSYGDGDANNNSLIMRMWVDGQSVMFFNDAGKKASTRLMNTYGADFLKADVVNMAHHGQNGVSQEMYAAVDAKIRLWAANNYVWNDDGTNTSLETTDVRTWVLGSPDKFTENTDTDLVACLSTFPTDIYSVSAWTEEVLNSMKLELPNVVAAKESLGFRMNEGATLRLDEGLGNAGLRFSARMHAYDDQATYGFVIAPREYFEEYSENYAQNLIANKSTKQIIDLKCKLVDGAIRNTGNYFEIQAGISMIKYDNMDREFTGLAYMIKDGVYTDASFASFDDISRSAVEVALQAKASGEYQDGDLDIVESFITKGLASAKGIAEADFDSSAAIATGLAIDKATETIVYGQSTTINVTADVSKDLISYEYDKDLIKFDSETGVVTPLEIGQATITAKCGDDSQTFTLTTNTAEGYYTTFDNAGTLKDVSLSTRAYRTGTSIATELATNVTDKTGVSEPTAVKITATASGGGISDIVIDLPKDVDVSKGGVTIAINVAQTTSTFAIFNVHTYTTNPETGKPLLDAIDPVSYSGKGQRLYTDASGRDLAVNTWKYIYIDYTTATTDFDKVILAMSGAPANGETVLYVAYVAEGDVSAEKTAAAQEQIMEGLRATLTDNYIAQFDNDIYATLATQKTGDYYFEGGMKVEVLDEFEGESGVLKISGTMNTVNGQVIVAIKMPKAFTTSFTARFYVASNADGEVPGLLGFCNADNTYVSGGHFYNDTALAGDTWHTKMITPTSAGDTIYFLAGWAKGFALEAYVSFVFDGDYVEYEKNKSLTEIKESLAEDEAATFDRIGYTYFVGKYSYNSNAYEPTATYLDTYAEKSGVLQVAVVPHSTWVAGFEIELPKEVAGKKVQVTFQHDNAALIKFEHPETKATYLSEDLTATKNAWITVELDYTSATSNKLVVYILANPSSVSVVNVYFDLVKVLPNPVGECINALKDGEIASFNVEAYTQLISNPTTHPVKSFTAEILESVTDGQGVTMQNVMKLTLDLTTSANWSFVNITLPKAHSGDYTIEYYLPEFPSAGQIGVKDETGTLVKHDWQVVGVWTSYHADPTNASDTFAIGMVNHAKTGNLVIYLSAIYDGDKTEYVNEKIYKSNLGENEISNFDLAGYVNFVTTPDATYRPYNVSVEWLETYGEASGVLKISGTVNSTGNQGRLALKLVTPHTGVYTIKYSWGEYLHSDGETTSLAAGRWVTGMSNATTLQTNTKELTGPQSGVTWNTTVVDTSSWGADNNYIGIQFWGSAVTLNDGSTTENCGFVMYIDCIYNGDVTGA